MLFIYIWMVTKLRGFTSLLNYLATIFGTVSTLSDTHSFNMYVDGKYIKSVYELTTLGVEFVERIGWNSYEKKIIFKASMLSRLHGNFTIQSASVAYISINRLILDYCDTMLDFCSEGSSQILQTLGRRVGRIVDRTARTCPAPYLNMISYTRNLPHLPAPRTEKAETYLYYHKYTVLNDVFA